MDENRTFTKKIVTFGHSTRFRRSDLASLSYFLAIARHRNFRLAGIELCVSTSALSHSMRGLEESVGVRLLNRTNRSVTLTAAGEQLLAEIEEPFYRIDGAINVLNRFRESPTGRIRLNVLDNAATHLIAPVMSAFMDRYPDIEIDLRVSNSIVDIVDGGYDAGIRYGGTVPQDMIAQRLSAEIRWVAVASPAYCDRFGIPEHPHDLLQHRCCQIRLGDDRIYRWEFDRGEESIQLMVAGAITIDDSETARALARHGACVMYAPEPMVRNDLERGELRIVLEGWSSIGSAMHIYYPSRRHVLAGLRLLIDLIRELRPLGY